jgi:hypothetical protein
VEHRRRRCRFVIDALVDEGFLKWTTKRTVIRTGRALTMAGPAQPELQISLTGPSQADTIVEGGPEPRPYFAPTAS